MVWGWKVLGTAAERAGHRDASWLVADEKTRTGSKGVTSAQKCARKSQKVEEVPGNGRDR